MTGAQTSLRWGEARRGVRDPVLPTGNSRLELAFLDYHAAHPEVWEMFARECLSRIARGRDHDGAKRIFENLRFDTSAGSPNGPREFKIPNNCIAYYARTFIATYPEHRGFLTIVTRVAA